MTPDHDGLAIALVRDALDPKFRASLSGGASHTPRFFPGFLPRFLPADPFLRIRRKPKASPGAVSDERPPLVACAASPALHAPSGASSEVHFRNPALEPAQIARASKRTAEARFVSPQPSQPASLSVCLPAQIPREPCAKLGTPRNFGIFGKVGKSATPRGGSPLAGNPRSAPTPALRLVCREGLQTPGRLRPAVKRQKTPHPEPACLAQWPGSLSCSSNLTQRPGTLVSQ